jgi:hypothetical protein
MGHPAASRTITFVFDARSLFGPLMMWTKSGCMDSSQSFCLARDLGTCESRFLWTKVSRNDNGEGVGSGGVVARLKSCPSLTTRPPRDDRGWGGLKLRGQNTHSNFAKGAKLEWGTRGCFLPSFARLGRWDTCPYVVRDEWPGGWPTLPGTVFPF